MDEGENARVIQIDKTDDPLGATVRNEGESIIVGRIIKGGAAEKSGLLHEGDEIVAVNGIEMRGKTVAQVSDELGRMTGQLSLLIIPNDRYASQNHSHFLRQDANSNQQPVMHIKVSKGRFILLDYKRIEFYFCEIRFETEILFFYINLNEMIFPRVK